ncbi:MAG: citrate synthase, partial [Phycisphaerales bacterium]|nr:citrate synthase [Phycisphaerales bacterium]
MSTTAAKGLEGIVAAETEMSFIDGTNGILEYVGIAIDDLARHSSFEETVFLLWNRRLPKQAELDAFTADLRGKYAIPAELVEVLKQMPKNAQPMHVLRTLVSALGAFDSDPNSVEPDVYRAKALNILAKAPTLVAYY